MWSKPARIWIAATVLASSFASAQVTRRVSVDSAGNQGAASSWLWFSATSISGDGRWVAFDSSMENLVPVDGNGWVDVFVHDAATRTTECVSVDPNGASANEPSWGPSISADGRFVAFTSYASNLVPVDVGDFYDVFVRNRATGTTELVSVDDSGNQGDGDSVDAVLSPDGRYVVFVSIAGNLVAGGANGYQQIYLRDRQAGTTELVSVSSSGAMAAFDCSRPSVSADGRFVVFDSWAANLVPGDTNHDLDVFLRDRQAGTTERVSVAIGAGEADGDSYLASISANGRFVAFWSHASNLVPGDTNGLWDSFVRDLQQATTERVNLRPDGTESMGDTVLYGHGPRLSPDGRYVAFGSAAGDLTAGDTNGVQDTFVRDRQAGTTERASVSSGGGQTQGGHAYTFAISDDARYVAFSSTATNVVPLDTNGYPDVFLRDRLPGSTITNFTSLCDPGSGPVIACPCSNPASGPQRGCDNSAASGGASLSASGDTELSADGLAFTAAGEMPTALSILAQGNAFVPNGIVYGQGVRCIGGTILRMYTASAQAGAVSFPNFQAGDPPVSVRSALKGDSIQPGQSRWYLVYYRDPNVLGGCPATSTFNSTQTGEIVWSP